MKLKRESLLILAIVILAGIIRLWALDRYPAGLNADEAAIGYNAYSLLQTGRDEHNQSWPLVFRSFDDYKPPLYFYLVLPFVAVLGLNVWAVRLPSAILGILSVYLIYLLARRLFPDRSIALGKLKLGVGELAALILAVSPWHVHFSRGGWEVNAATTLVLLGFVFLCQNPRRYLLAGLAFVASLYAYHAMRVILPFLLLSFALLEGKELFSVKEIKRWLLGILLAAALLVPLGIQFLSPSGSARFSGVSVFADEGPLWEALALRDEHNGQKADLAVRLLHNKYVTYSLRITKNYLAHYSPRFLFIAGDAIERSKVPGMGLALLLGLPFATIGLFQLINHGTKSSRFVLAWFLITPLAAAITFQSPHALRAQNMVIPLTLVTAFGVTALGAFSLRLRAITIAVLSLALVYETARYLHYYFLHYPQELPTAWEYGFEELGGYLKENEGKYERIIISDRYDQPYILVAFFTQYPPEKFQQEITLEPRDRFGFSTVRHFGKYEFRPIDFDRDIAGNNLVVVTGGGTRGEPIKTINFPNGQPAFRLFSSLK